MESLPEETRRGPEELSRKPPAGRLQRVQEETRGLAEDITAWVELKLRHTQMEIEETVEMKLNRAVVGAIVGVVAAIAALFLLVTAAIGIGWLLGHPFWGFLIITVLLFVVAAVVRARQPQLVRFRAERMGIGAPAPEQQSTEG